MRHILVKEGRAFVSGMHGYPVNTDALREMGIVFVGEDGQGFWYEREPFRGRDRDVPRAAEIARALLAEAKKKHDAGPFRDDTPEPTPGGVPMRVSAFQAFAALDEAGLLDAVEDYMAGPDTPKIERLAFRKARDFDRDSPLVAKIAELFNLSEAQVDELFTRAAQIEA